MKELKVFIDVDGVIFDINKKVIKKANNVFKTNYNYKKNKSWWWDDYIQNTNCGSREYFETLLSSDHFFRSGDSIKGSIENINKLYSEGFNLYFISSPHWESKTFMSDRIAYLKSCFDWFKAEKHLILTSDKSICDNYNIVLIDDYPHNLKGIKSGIPLCYAQPYNSFYNGIRLLNWDNIYIFLKLIKNGYYK